MKLLRNVINLTYFKRQCCQQQTYVIDLQTSLSHSALYHTAQKVSCPISFDCFGGHYEYWIWNTQLTYFGWYLCPCLSSFPRAHKSYTEYNKSALYVYLRTTLTRKLPILCLLLIKLSKQSGFQNDRYRQIIKWHQGEEQYAFNHHVSLGNENKLTECNKLIIIQAIDYLLSQKRLAYLSNITSKISRYLPICIGTMINILLSEYRSSSSCPYPTLLGVARKVVSYILLCQKSRHYISEYMPTN